MHLKIIVGFFHVYFMGLDENEIIFAFIMSTNLREETYIQSVL